MKIGYLGAGTWGFALASILADNGHEVVVWTRDPTYAEILESSHEHPKLKGFKINPSVRFTSDLASAVEGAEVLVESVTSSGIRSVFSEIQRQFGQIKIPIILTSKGIEQGTGFLMPEVISDILGESQSSLVGSLSGPSHAEEVIQNMPTSIVCSSYNPDLIKLIYELFSTPTFRIYPNGDLHGVCFGGAMKKSLRLHVAFPMG